MYAEVLTQINSKMVDKTFTYIVPDGMNAKVGCRVLIPFGKRNIEGFILKINNTFDGEYKLKPITKLIDNEPVINKEMLDLGKYISKKTISPLIVSYQTMLPKALKTGNSKDYKKYVKYITCIGDSNITTVKQQEIYDYIKEKGKIKKTEATKLSSSIIKTLLDKEAIKEVEIPIYRLEDEINIEKDNHKFTEQQEQVFNKITFDGFNPYLLHGVTGSGKTLVYIRLIEKVINNNKTAILLVPEISLTPQVVMRFKKNFGDKVAILHSGLSDGEKYGQWRKIEEGKASIAIGARSAIFAPFINLGIIIIDEEHSATYKQENTPKYDAIDVAIYRAKKHKCPLLLGSATPSIESYTRARTNIYTLLEMTERVNKNMPKVTLVNMQDEFKKGNRIFSSLLIDKINDRLLKNQQVMILLNRRGYTTIITCKECGYTHKCPNCDIPYTYHKKTNSMKCHYCNSTTYPIKQCPQCHSKNINAYGMGTEKLEDLIKEKFGSRVIRMDNDTTRRKGAHEKIIRDFENGKYDILVGTQMISKGLDFPNVTLVIVLNADSTLNIPDFRSAERTYQLLSQVAGRAGRSQKKGEVIIQGFNIDHYSIIAAQKHDYMYFYNEEIKIRKKLKYPPFYNLTYIKVSSKNENKALNEADKIASYLKKNLPNNIILGPSYASIPKINNIYYVGIIIKYKNTKEIMPYLIFINDKYTSKDVMISIDLNPINLS